MRIGYDLFANAFESIGDAPTPLQLGACQSSSCTAQIPRIVSGTDRLVTPTHPRVSTQTARRLRIACVQEATHIAALLALAVGGCAFKDVDSAAVNIFDTRGAIEEHVDR
jgi:hypothetical protein